MAAWMLTLLAIAGGGPETTVVVANADSPLSRLIANEYAAMRGIPADNLVFLEGIAPRGVISLEDFRRLVLEPLRGVQADTIAFSVDFPFGVDLSGVKEGAAQGFTPTGSLTGLTYLGRRDGEPYVREVYVNEYFAGKRPAAPRQATSEEREQYARAVTALRERRYEEAAAAYQAFVATYEGSVEAWYNLACCLARLGRADEAMRALENAARQGWADAEHTRADPDLEPLRGREDFRALVARLRSADVPQGRGFRAADERYVLAVALGYAGRWGNSVPEILGYLRAAAQSDGVRPDGVVYFCRNDDVRSRARHGFFESAVEALEARGRRAEIVDAVLPKDRGDVMGAVVGIAGFSWPKCGSTILPGAICEHLTSFGADFRHGGQTKLSEFLRHGAAGASGTVAEPYAIWQKFPHPYLHAYYADGCSLAEAFYQSVAWPYQLLVVGDPLARPFARFVEVSFDAPEPPWRGTVELAPRAEGAATFELFVDGRLVTAGSRLTFDTTRVDDGVHDVRVVAIADGPAATRSFARIEATVGNGSRTLSVKAPESVRFGEPIRLACRAPGARSFEVLHGSRVVASGSRPVVDSAAVGPGPVSVVVRATFPDGPAVRSAPLAVRVEPPALVPARGKGSGDPGLAGEADGRKVVAESLEDWKGEPCKRLVLEGEMEVPEAGFWQLTVEANGEARVLVAGRRLGAGPRHPLWLEAGWHPIRIELAPDGEPRIAASLAGRAPAGPPKLRHR